MIQNHPKYHLNHRLGPPNNGPTPKITIIWPLLAMQMMPNAMQHKPGYDIYVVYVYDII